MRPYLALMLSFGVYFFPVPGQEYFWANWGGMVLTLLHKAADLNMAAYLILALAVVYQLLCAYCIYRFLDLNLIGMIIFLLPLVLALYAILLFVIFGTDGFHLLMDIVRKLVWRWQTWLSLS